MISSPASLETMAANEGVHAGCELLISLRLGGHEGGRDRAFAISMVVHAVSSDTRSTVQYFKTICNHGLSFSACSCLFGSHAGCPGWYT